MCKVGGASESALTRCDIQEQRIGYFWHRIYCFSDAESYSVSASISECGCEINSYFKRVKNGNHSIIKRR